MKNINSSGPLKNGSRAGRSPKHTSREKLKWHPAFVKAMELELFEYRDALTFKTEHPLNSEPLRIDLLIIKKPKELKIDKNIARIFKSDNIIEYKSPEDYISIKDFLKVYAYANLYAAITPNVDFSEITITLIESRYPRKLVSYLKNTRSYKVQKKSAGVYYVNGDYVPIQIVVSKELPQSDNLWLESLREDLKNNRAQVIVDEKEKYGEKVDIDVYMDVVIRANPRVFSEVQTMTRKRRETLDDIIIEKGWDQKYIERGREQGRAEAKAEKLAIARNLLAKGSSLEFTSEITGLPPDEIANL